MRLSISGLAGDAVLGGSAKGGNLLAKLIQAVASANYRGPLFLDFAGVEIATSSFLREAVLGLRSYFRESRPELQVVVANADSLVFEELNLVLVRHRDALVACNLDDNDAVIQARIIGQLDEKQALTLRAVIERGEGDATNLADEYEEDDAIGPTGWSNRLAALAAKGILVETRQGRSKIYRPVVEGISDGT